MHTKTKDIDHLINRWSSFANRALGQEPIDGKAFRILFRDTFKVLNEYDAQHIVPKQIIELSICMSEFSAFALLSEDRKGVDPQMLHIVTLCLLDSFVNGFKVCNSLYPTLRVKDFFNMEYINLETNDLLDLQFVHRDLPF